MKIKTYSELMELETFEERFEYLKLGGIVGQDTFGFDRYMNQQFYKRSKEWAQVRDHVIIRDSKGDYCLDLGADGHEIYGKIIVHHMNPISPNDIKHSTEFLLDPEFLISTMLITHNAIHYGDSSLLIKPPIERTKNDTCPWRH